MDYFSLQSSKDLKKVEKRFALGYPMIKPFSQDDTYYTYVWLYSTRKEPSVVLTCLHHHCKISKLNCSPINIKTVKIILYDFCRSLTFRIPMLLVNLH